MRRHLISEYGDLGAVISERKTTEYPYSYARHPEIRRGGGGGAAGGGVWGLLSLCSKTPPPPPPPPFPPPPEFINNR